MKMLKSLILGTAAIFAASWGAQAADLPVKARPVEYVKICSAYGAGFYYIPGTDICLRVGGYMWYDLNINQRGEGVDIGNVTFASGRETRNDGYLTQRVRAIMIMDARTSTPYGTLRSYIAVGEHWTSNNAVGSPTGAVQSVPTATGNLVGDANVYWERAFIQFAGWTFGYVGSFFDFNPNYTFVSLNTTSFKWTPAIAYTIQYGGGISSTLSLEDSTARRSQIQFGFYSPVVLNAGSAVCGAAGNCYGSSQMPDFIVNLRADGAWGSAQIAGAIHQVLPNNLFGVTPEALGWAINAGIEVKLPSGAGDTIMLQGVVGKGATEFTGLTNFPVLSFNGVGWTNGAGLGPVFDAMDAYINPLNITDLELTKQWAANLQVRHFWMPNLRSAAWIGINKQNMPPAATLFGFPDLTLVQGGLNTIWSPVKDLDLGVEIVYTNLKTTCGSAVCTVFFNPWTNASDSVWSGVFRARRNW